MTKKSLLRCSHVGDKNISGPQFCQMCGEEFVYAADGRTAVIEEVKKLLLDEGYLRSLEQVPFRKPTHGSCCTCQTCGQYHDECVCVSNELLSKLEKMKGRVC